MSDQESDDETRGIGPGSRGTSARLGNNKKNNNPALLKTPSQQKKVKKATTKEVEAANQAEAAWTSLYPDLPSAWKLPVNVTFKPLSMHDYGPMQVAHDKFNAWTNSPTEIYVIPVPQGFASPQNKRDAYWRVVLYHEAWHLKQFAEASRPPKTYTKMMAYEVQAYGESKKWIKNTTHPKKYSPWAMKKLGKMMSDAYTKFNKKVISTQKQVARYKDPQFAQEQLEQEYWIFLDQKLPTHRCLEQLYGQPC